MVRIKLNLGKTLMQNAAAIFDAAKTARKKAEGARAAAARLRSDLSSLAAKEEAAPKKMPKAAAKPLQWFEKLRWFRSSTGFLCIGGRDASTNEIVIKKHTRAGDLVFHTEDPGSPFFVIQAEGKPIDAQTIREAAEATAGYSRAWKRGLAAVEVYHITPEQVSKTAESGEYLPRGGFMIRGKRTYLRNVPVSLAVGKTADGLVMGGPESAVRAHCSSWMRIAQGKDKPSDAAKQIAKRIDSDVDSVLRALPAGEFNVSSP